MIIKMKYDRKIISINVSRFECKKFKCFTPCRDINSNEHKFFYCAVRDKHGCPDNPEVKNAKKQYEKNTFRDSRRLVQ
jgi:hypothetical protein